MTLYYELNLHKNKIIDYSLVQIKVDRVLIIYRTYFLIYKL